MAIRPSLRFTILLLLCHALAAISVYAADMPLPTRVAIIALILPSLIYYLARDVWLFLPDSWCEITLEQNTVTVMSRDGSCFAGQLANKTVVSPYFIVLRIRPDGYRLPVSRVIFPDALGTGEFRDLCVRLKFA